MSDISKMAEKEVTTFIFPMETLILTTICGWNTSVGNQESSEEIQSPHLSKIVHE